MNKIYPLSIKNEGLKSFWTLVVWIMCSTGYGQLQQKGTNLLGETNGDLSGCSVAVNENGTVVAIGAKNNNGSGSNSGHVRVYQWNGTAWLQLGIDINGEAVSDQSGYAISLSNDGTVLAIGAPYNEGGGSTAGHVRIYAWSGTAWIQKGGDINGTLSEISGAGVSLSGDGNKVIVGGPSELSSSVDAGSVKVYEFNGAAWIQKGATIDGSFLGDNFGYAVAINDAGDRIAAGAINSDNSGFINNGLVEIYDWDGSNWIQTGSSINGQQNGDNFGFSLDLNSNGNTLATGAINNDLGGTNAGYVRIYEWDETNWVPKGSYIAGQAAGDEAGTAVSVSGSGEMIIIGAPLNDDGGTSSGQVHVYKWNGTTWQSFAPAENGPVANAWLGTAVAISKDAHTFICGLPGYNSSKGLAKIYTCNTASSVNAVACEMLTSPSGMYTWTASGIYQDTIPNVNGCDSVITVNLEIIQATFATIFTSSCTGYTSPSGIHTWYSTGTYQDTVPNVNGCDSVITINLEIFTPTLATIFANTCTGYLSPSGLYTWSSSGIYQDTIVNIVGCDSIITINLTSTSIYTYMDTMVCTDFISPAGKYKNESSVFNDTLSTIEGCDSIIEITLTVMLPEVEVLEESGYFVSSIYADKYTWFTCDDILSPITGADEKIYVPVKEGSYTLTIETGGCIDTAACLFFNILTEIITAFSPNGDGVNDVLELEIPYAENEVFIYNRWGDRVAKFVNYDDETVVWDGRNSRGEELEGTFYYVINSEGYNFASWVQIVR